MSTLSTFTPSILTPRTPLTPSFKNLFSNTDQRSPYDAPLVAEEVQLEPFSKLKICLLPTTQDFEQKFKVEQIVKSDTHTTTVLIKNIANTGYSIAKIYNCAGSNRKKTDKKMKKMWNQYQIVKYSGLMEYFRLYYDQNTQSVTIHKQAYQKTLRSFISRKGALENERKVKVIAYDILQKLQTLHSYGFVHCNLKPSNIMHRKLDHLYTTEFISDGWLIIDFDRIHRHKSKDVFVGSMGWTAPETKYGKGKSVYRYANDIFAFGLLILYAMFGCNPLEMDESGGNTHELAQYWYENKVLKGENKIGNYLVQMYFENRISLELFTLLNDGMLVWDYKKRLNCAQILESAWFSDHLG